MLQPRNSLTRWFVIALFLFPGCAKQPKPHRFTTGEIEQVVRSGKVGSEMATWVAHLPSISVREISVAGIPVQLFAFDDEGFTHTLLVDGDQFVLVCAGPKGTIPTDFRLEQTGSLRVLTFKFGVTDSSGAPQRGRYFLGTAQPDGFLRRE